MKLYYYLKEEQPLTSIKVIEGKHTFLRRVFLGEKAARSKGWELAVLPQCGLCRVEGWLGGCADVLAGVEGGGLAVYVTQAGVGQGSQLGKKNCGWEFHGEVVAGPWLSGREGDSGCRRPRTECRSAPISAGMLCDSALGVGGGGWGELGGGAGLGAGWAADRECSGKAGGLAAAQCPSLRLLHP